MPEISHTDEIERIKSALKTQRIELSKITREWDLEEHERVTIAYAIDELTDAIAYLSTLTK